MKRPVMNVVQSGARMLSAFSAVAAEYGVDRAAIGAVRSLLHRVSGRPEPPTLGHPDHDPSTCLNLLDSHGAIFSARSGTHDADIIEETWQAYIRWLEETSIGRLENVLDLGAHIGGFSLHLAQSMQPMRRIYALEPEPTNFDLLCDNIARNDRETLITAINAAAYSRNGSAHLRLAGSNTGGHHISFGTQGPHRRIETRDIREVVDGIDGPISLMKIDVEGWEFPIIRRLGDRISRIEAIIGEAHSTYFCSPTSFFRYLKSRGFVVRTRGDNPRMPLFLAKR
jgi:FkbM family methyltransferase